VDQELRVVLCHSRILLRPQLADRALHHLLPLLVCAQQRQKTWSGAVPDCYVARSGGREALTSRKSAGVFSLRVKRTTECPRGATALCAA
jgi:hypothetical protein